LAHVRSGLRFVQIFVYEHVFLQSVSLGTCEKTSTVSCTNFLPF
jgi:hypothetical protein